MAGQHVKDNVEFMIDGFQSSLIDAAARFGAATLALTRSLLLLPAGGLRLRCP